MAEKYQEVSRSSGPAFSPEAFIKWLPWGIVGVIVVLGLLISLTAGMPWETKEHANDQSQLIDTPDLTGGFFLRSGESGER